jgi:hypothetical protein
MSKKESALLTVSVFILSIAAIGYFKDIWGWGFWLLIGVISLACFED